MVSVRIPTGGRGWEVESLLYVSIRCNNVYFLLIISRSGFHVHTQKAQC